MTRKSLRVYIYDLNFCLTIASFYSCFTVAGLGLCRRTLMGGRKVESVVVHHSRIYYNVYRSMSPEFSTFYGPLKSIDDGLMGPFFLFSFFTWRKKVNRFLRNGKPFWFYRLGNSYYRFGRFWQFINLFFLNCFLTWRVFNGSIFIRPVFYQ